MPEKMTIQLGHSPDPDDAFMFYGLATCHLDSGPCTGAGRLAA